MGLHRAQVVKGPDQDRAPARERAEPVVVGVVGVNDLDAFRPDQPSQPDEVRDEVARGEAVVQRQVREGLDPDLARLASKRSPRITPRNTRCPRSRSPRTSWITGSALPVHQRLAARWRIVSGFTG